MFFDLYDFYFSVGESNAIVLARLIAVATFLWCLLQVPVLLGAIIFPRWFIKRLMRGMLR